MPCRIVRSLATIKGLEPTPTRQSIGYGIGDMGDMGDMHPAYSPSPLSTPHASPLTAEGIGSQWQHVARHAWPIQVIELIIRLAECDSLEWTAPEDMTTCESTLFASIQFRDPPAQINNVIFAQQLVRGKAHVSV